jgi:serine/threonine-protein kinase
VPNVVGETQSAAGTTLTGANLTTGAVTQQCSGTVAEGLVIGQTPAAGAQAPYGSAVALVLSTGPCNVTVPDLLGQTQAAATAMVFGAGLIAGEITEECSDTVPEGLVISQNPAPGTQMAPGSAVAFAVSTGSCKRCGCAGCSGGKDALTPDLLRKALGDLFLGGLSLTVLLAASRRKR